MVSVAGGWRDVNGQKMQFSFVRIADNSKRMRGGIADHGRKGFTLIEILLVIALIGLLTGFLLVDWGNVSESFGRRNWKQSIEESFRRAHYLAETEDEALRVRFDPEESVLVLERLDGGEELERFPLRGVEEISEVATGASTSLSRGARDLIFSIEFGRDGSAETVVFDVTRSDGESRFQNHPFSGRLIDPEEEGSELFR